MKILLLNILIIFQVNFCPPIDNIRNLFNKAQTETDLANIIAICKKNPCSETTAYLAASTMRMASYSWSPVKKLALFNMGKKLLEHHIAQHPTDVEARYIRWMCQKNSPLFLGYQENLQQDKLYIIQNLQESSITPSYKKIIIQNIKNHE